LHHHEPVKLYDLVSVHYLNIKSLASQDDEFFKIIIDYLPFTTNEGLMHLPDFEKKSAVIRFVENVNEFQQIASIASAQNIPVINAGYLYDAEILLKIPKLLPLRKVEKLTAAQS